MSGAPLGARSDENENVLRGRRTAHPMIGEKYRGRSVARTAPGKPADYQDGRKWS